MNPLLYMLVFVTSGVMPAALAYFAAYLSVTRVENTPLKRAQTPDERLAEQKQLSYWLTKTVDGLNPISPSEEDVDEVLRGLQLLERSSAVTHTREYLNACVRLAEAAMQDVQISADPRFITHLRTLVELQTRNVLDVSERSKMHRTRTNSIVQQFPKLVESFTELVNDYNQPDVPKQGFMRGKPTP